MERMNQTVRQPGFMHAPGSDCRICKLPIVESDLVDWFKQAAEDRPDSKPEPLENPEEGGNTWYHGTRSNWGEGAPAGPLALGQEPSHWNTALGAHFTSLHSTAHNFVSDPHVSPSGPQPGSRIAHVKLHMKNPAFYPDERQLGIDFLHKSGAEDDGFHAYMGHDYDPAYPCKHCDDKSTGFVPVDEHHQWDVGHDYEPDHSFETSCGECGFGENMCKRINQSDFDRDIRALGSSLPKYAEKFKNHLKAKGHDGIIYGNSYEAPIGHKCAIAFDDTRVTVKKWENFEDGSEDGGEKKATALFQHFAEGIDPFLRVKATAETELDKASKKHDAVIEEAERPKTLAEDAARTEFYNVHEKMMDIKRGARDKLTPHDKILWKAREKADDEFAPHEDRINDKINEAYAQLKPHEKAHTNKIQDLRNEYYTEENKHRSRLREALEANGGERHGSEYLESVRQAHQDFDDYGVKHRKAVNDANAELEPHKQAYNARHEALSAELKPHEATRALAYEAAGNAHAPHQEEYMHTVKKAEDTIQEAREVWNDKHDAAGQEHEESGRADIVRQERAKRAATFSRFYTQMRNAPHPRNLEYKFHDENHYGDEDMHQVSVHHNGEEVGHIRWANDNHYGRDHGDAYACDNCGDTFDNYHHNEDGDSVCPSCEEEGTVYNEDDEDGNHFAGEIGYIHVKPAYQRHGIGTNLVKKAREFYESGDASTRAEHSSNKTPEGRAWHQRMVEKDPKMASLFDHFASNDDPWTTHNFDKPVKHTASSDSGVGDRFSDEMPEGREVPPNAVGYEPHEDEFWVSCGKGHTHYGEHGAAGMLIRHTDDEGNHRYLLQKRAPWVDHGNTWGVPGGAIRKGENPEEAAMNETKEEIGHLPGLKPIHRYTDDHDGWAYHTIVAQAPERFNISDADQNDESSGTGWFTREEMNKLPLHPGFASSVDKVIGSVGKTATLNNLFQHFALNYEGGCDYCGGSDNDDIGIGPHSSEDHEDHIAEKTPQPEDLKNMSSINRYVNVSLTDEDHSIIHDKTKPVEFRARHLLNRLQKGVGDDDNGLGFHWAHPKADKYNEDFSWDGSKHEDNPTAVKISAEVPEHHQIEDSGEKLMDDGFWGYEDPEWEVPLKYGTPVNVKSVAWRKSDDDPWTTHNFDKPVKHTAARDFGPNKGPLPIQHGLYYRVHYTPRKWETEKATSTPGLMYKKQKEEYGDRTEPGYSSFDNPHDLHRYWDGKYWAGEKASTESQHQKHYKNAEDWFNKNHKVVIFKGEEVGRGHDQEPLVQPTHKADRQELSIEEFKQRLSQTPHPDTFDHWHEAEPLDPGGHYWSGNWWHGNGEKCDDAERCHEDFPEPSSPEADPDTFAHYWDNHEDDDSVTHTAANEPKPLTKLQEDILYRVKTTGTVDMAKDVHNCRLYGDQQTFGDHLGNIADELGYHNGLKQKDVDAVSKHIENHAQKTLIDAGFPETFSVWRKPLATERGVVSVTTQTGGTKTFRPANEYKINRSDVLTHGEGFLGDYQSFAEDELHVPLDKMHLVNERTAVLDSWRPNQRLFAPTIGSLDPRLFEDDKIRPEVRNFVMDRLAGLWDGKYDNWREWSRVYLAGSSISEWWADVNAIRDPEIGLTQGYHLNDDLDTLIGVEYGGLVEANPQFAGMSPKKVSAHMNAELREFCNMEGVYIEIPVEGVPEWEWSAQPVAGKVRVGPWGATWYVNPNSYDIRAIKPYAAYDLTRDEWAVRPVQEPTGHQFSPTEWYYFEGVAQEIKGTLALPEPARSRRAKRLWNFIHSTRNKAFTPSGSGVFDFRNAVEKYLDQAGLWQPLVKAQFPDQKTAGANGNLPEGIQFEHSEDEHDHHITARVPGAKGYNWGDEGTVGRLSWTKHDLDPDTSLIHEISRPLDAGTVTDVDVHPDYQRRGIASAMWEQAKTHADRFQVPGPYHSELQTDEGQEWAARTATALKDGVLQYDHEEAKGRYVREGSRFFAGKGKRRDRSRPEDLSGDSSPSGSTVGPDDESRGNGQVPRTIVYGSAAKRDLKKLEVADRQNAYKTVDRIANNEPNLQTHGIKQLPGILTTKINRRWRVLHSSGDNNELIVHGITLHDYDEMVRRMTSREQSQ